MKAEEFASLVKERSRLLQAWYRVNQQIPRDYPRGPDAPIVTIAVTIECGQRDACLVEIKALSLLLLREIERMTDAMQRAIENRAIEL